MTDYSAIDPILMAWAQGRKVHVYMRDRDWEVRSILIFEPSGQQRHMWVDPIDDNGRVGVHAAKSDGWKLDRSVSPADLENALDEVYDAMTSPARS